MAADLAHANKELSHRTNALSSLEDKMRKDHTEALAREKALHNRVATLETQIATAKEELKVHLIIEKICTTACLSSADPLDSSLDSWIDQC